MLIIRKALKNEYRAVMAFYEKLIDEMDAAKYYIGWRKGYYPEAKVIQDAIENNELFIGLIENEIVASMVVNSSFNEGYNQIDWPTEAKKEDIFVIHTLGVLLSKGKRGYAKAMIDRAICYAHENYKKVIRLDVVKNNIPAEKLYLSQGFKYVAPMELYYEEAGTLAFKLFELTV